MEDAKISTLTLSLSLQKRRERGKDYSYGLAPRAVTNSANPHFSSPMRNALEEAVVQMGLSICTTGVVFCAPF